MELTYCEALKTALEFEKSGEALYRDSLAKVKDPFAKKVLEFLADEEVDHARKIVAFNDALMNNEAFDFETECGVGVSPRIKELVREHAEAGDERIAADSADLDIYDVAMDMEKRGYNVYESALEDPEVAGDERLKRFFEFMVAEEREHYDLLAVSKRYLEDPGYYFLEEGGWIFS